MCVRRLQILYATDECTTCERTLIIRSPTDAVAVLARYLAPEAVEVFGVLCLTVQHRPLAFHEVSRGCLDAVLVHPREVFKAAILSNAGAILVAHNHPSGDPHPSPDDHRITHRLRECGQVLGIPLLDHLVIGSSGTFYSFVINGYVEAASEGGTYDRQNCAV